MSVGAPLLPVDMPNCSGVGRPTAGEAFAGCQQKDFPRVGLLLDGSRKTCVLVQWLCMDVVQAAVWMGKVLGE